MYVYEGGWVFHIQYRNTEYFKSNMHMGGGLFVYLANLLDCDIVVSEFELQLRYYVHFWTLREGMDPLITPVMGQILPLLFFYKDGFGIK